MCCVRNGKLSLGRSINPLPQPAAARVCVQAGSAQPSADGDVCQGSGAPGRQDNVIVASGGCVGAAHLTDAQQTSSTHTHAHTHSSCCILSLRCHAHIPLAPCCAPPPPHTHTHTCACLVLTPAAPRAVPHVCAPPSPHTETSTAALPSLLGCTTTPPAWHPTCLSSAVLSWSSWCWGLACWGTSRPGASSIRWQQQWR